MAFFLWLLFLSVMLPLAHAEEINVTVSAVQKLVDYDYALESGELLAGLRYQNSITATWAVPSSALRGLDGQVVTVKVSAAAGNDSAVNFASSEWLQQKSAEAYLSCEVQDGTCSNQSNLSATIPFSITLQEGQNASALISLRAEIVRGTQVSFPTTGDLGNSAGGIFDSIKNALGQNGSGQQGPEGNASAHNGSNSSGDFLDSLKPEGDSKNPLAFLQENPLISLAALAIVIVITGAYLINAKD